MKTWFPLICTLLLGHLLLIPQVSAQTAPQEYFPINCDRTKGNYRVMDTLVLVPLTDDLTLQTGKTAEELAKNLFYEFAYVRGNNVAPINALTHGGQFISLTCDYPDYLANVVMAENAGYYILGVSGELPTALVQEVINSLKLTKIIQAELVSVTDEKNTTIALANEKNCTALCQGIKPSSQGTEKRSYAIELSEPVYSKSVRQKELVSFSVQVKNTSEFPIYPSGAGAVSLQTTARGISPLYHASWLSPGIIARLPGILLPGDETAMSVSLGSPLLPGKYSESFVIKMGSTQVGKHIPVSFSVENDNFKLGRVISRDGADFVNLRETPNLRGPIVNRLDIGTYVIIKGYQDAWVRIETKEGRTGWIYKPFLREL